MYQDLMLNQGIYGFLPYGLYIFESFVPDKMEELAEKIFSYRGQSWKRHAEEIYESLYLDSSVWEECSSKTLENMNVTSRAEILTDR